MFVIIFNWLGFAFLAVGFAIAMSVRAVAGIQTEGASMLILGPVVLATDLAYRLLRKDGHWFSSSRGGSLFFLPVWMFGVLWTVLGAVYLYRGGSAGA